jgi:2-iminobutanoate/2-iminopropanoate deaminase
VPRTRLLCGRMEAPRLAHRRHGSKVALACVVGMVATLTCPLPVGAKSESKGSDKRENIRVEPLSTWLETFAPTATVTRYGDMIFLAGMPPFDPATGKVVNAPIERQTELVLEQMKRSLEAAGSDMEHVLKVNVYAKSIKDFSAINSVYVKYFKKPYPARIFLNVQDWPSHFDLEIDCVAAVKR